MFSIKGRELFLILFALGGIALLIQFISTAFEQRNTRTQDQHILKDGNAPERDVPKGL